MSSSVTQTSSGNPYEQYQAVTTNNPPPSCPASCLTSGPIYVACNEGHYHETLQYLKHLPLVGNGIHIGWACQFNYDVIAIRHPQQAIICDINSGMHHLYEKINELIKLNNNKKDFLEQLNEFLNHPEVAENLSYNYEYRSPGELLKFLTHEDSWLSSDESYEYVRTMHIEGRITYLALDITNDSGYFTELRQWIDNSGYQVDTLYASNIVEWLKTPQAQGYYRINLELLMTAHSHFIYAKRPGLDRKENPQQVVAQQIPQEYIPEPKYSKKTMRLPPSSKRTQKTLNFGAD